MNYRECERDLSWLKVKHILGIKWFNFFPAEKEPSLTGVVTLIYFAKTGEGRHFLQSVALRTEEQNTGD